MPALTRRRSPVASEGKQLLTRDQKITLGEMRSSGVRGLLVYCADYKCSHFAKISGDRWPDDIRLSVPAIPQFATSPIDLRALWVADRKQQKYKYNSRTESNSGCYAKALQLLSNQVAYSDSG